MTSDVDVLVVGGGPAGLIAARTAANRGLSVAILEESDRLGGQYFRQSPHASYDDHRPEGRTLIEEVATSGAHLLTGWSVWGADGRDLLIAPRRGGRTRRVRGRHMVIATGAHEVVVPFPGWQLPGVVTPGFALHTAAIEGVALGGPVLIAGTGPFLLVVAQALLRAGVEVAGVAEESPLRPTVSSAGHSLRYPRQLRQLAALLATLARHRVPWWRSTTLVAAEGATDGVRCVHLAQTRRDGTVRSWSVSSPVVCAAFGFRPSSELTQLLGCAHRLDQLTGSPVPVTDPAGRTSIPGVHAVGDGAGIGGADLAMARAYLAIADICSQEGRPFPGRDVDRQRRQADRLERFAAFNSRLFPLPRSRFAALADDLVVCRCEAVTAGEIRAATSSGWHDLSGVKGATRAGMGPCQGRECAVSVQALAEAGGLGPSRWSVRMPLRPVTLEAASHIAERIELAPSCTKSPGPHG